MNTWYLALALLLLGTIVCGLWRVIRGPSPADRMLAAQLFGTTGVAVLLLLGEHANNSSFRDVALVLVILALVAVAAFTNREPARGSEMDSTRA